MKPLSLIISVALIALLVWLNYSSGGSSGIYGGLTPVGWMSIALLMIGLGFVFFATDSARSFGYLGGRRLRGTPPPNIRTLTSDELRELGLDKYRGPVYPHPVIFPDRCIGCQACVDVCPHDVLAIVDGRAMAVAPDLCMDDTACQAECPVNPKALIVINTAKAVRSLPVPTRDGSTYETNVPGCYIIGDVSGVPLIKNAVKEGAEVIAHIADDLKAAVPDAKAEYDVAIIGVGPGGASSAAAARDSNLRYVALEQSKILSTIDLYPKGKYIFFKPDTKDWTGGIPVLGLGLSKAKYGGGDDDHQSVIETIGDELKSDVHEAATALHARLIASVPRSLRADVSPRLEEKLEKEFKKRIAGYLRSKGTLDWMNLYRAQFLPEKDSLLTQFADDIADQLTTKIPGDQRESILDIWLGTLADKGVVVNEDESCKSVKRAENGDHFVIDSERGNQKLPQTYTARRVILSIGLRGAPNKLRLPNEDMKVAIDGREQQKVLYALSNPMDFRGKRIVVVGGGNVAVEAAVDLVAVRDGATITSRSAADMNQVTVLVRDYLAPTVKFGNKFQLYQCADAGIIDLRLGVGIKEMREHEVVLEDVKTKQEVGTISNDYVFALIGGERPNRFLESIGITIK